MIFGSNESIRALKCEQSVLSRADGSVILSQGNTVVMASVYGPLEAKIQKELSDRMYIDLNFKPKTGMPGVAERGKEKLIKTTCNQIITTHLHPRTAVNITIQEMQDGGAVTNFSKKYSVWISSSISFIFVFDFRYWPQLLMLPALP